MEKIIKLTEIDLYRIVKKVLNEQGSADVNIGLLNKKQLSQSELKYGNTGDNVKKLQQALMDIGLLKTDTMVPTGYFGDKTLAALKQFQIMKRMPATGVFNELTKSLLFVGGFNNNKNSTEKKGGLSKTSTTNNNRCIAISKEECAKISSSKETVISTGTETRCSAYMVKCLSQYNSELYGANAWNVFNKVKGNGQVKYNAYTDGSVNWNNIYSQIKQYKIGKNICNKYAKSDDADKVVNSNLPNIVTNSIPQSAKINISSLELGDIVGLYHKNSENKGMAFCQRALTRNLDDNGNMEKDPFTFNSHVGFVGAIKDGVPIVIHNIHGSHTATPATKMLNKNDKDMIVWVVGDNEVKSAVNNNSGEEKKSSSSGWNFFN